MPLTFLHTGDEHIDSDVHGSINPATGLNTAWESNYAVVRFLAEMAVERGVDFFLSAGDNFNTGRPSQEALLLFVDALAPLAEAHIPIVLLDGNHHMTGVPSDHRTVIHVVAAMLEAHGATVQIAAEPTLLTLPGAQIAALPWMSKNRVLAALGETSLSPDEGDRRVAQYGIDTLARLADGASADLPLIMASHVTVDDVRLDAVTDGHSRGSEIDIAHLFSEPVLPRKSLEALPFAYGALAHIHTPQRLSARYWYAGSPNRLTFTDMPDVKGANLVTIPERGEGSVERIVTPARVMAELDLDDSHDIGDIAPGTLLRVWLETGNPELPRDVRKAIHDAGAILADTRARPAPRVETERVVLPEQVDLMTALRTWAGENLPAKADVEELVAAAERLEA